MSILSENWKQKLAQMLDRDVDEVDAVIKKKDFSFSDFLEIGQAVEQEDIETITHLFKTVGDVDIDEADNPYTSSSPQTPTLDTSTPSVSQRDEKPTKDIESLTPGDTVSVTDLSGNEVETTIRSRGPGDTYVVTGKDGDSVVKRDNIKSTPAMNESILTESMVDGLQTLRTTLPQFRQDPPSITKKAVQEIYSGHQLPPRLSIAIEPYIRMLDAVISNSTMRYRFINLIKMAINDNPDQSEFDSDELEMDIEGNTGLELDTDTDTKVTKETTTAGAIASAPVAVGKPIKRKQKTKESSERSKKR